jgi:hypothetical protein
MAIPGASSVSAAIEVPDRNYHKKEGKKNGQTGLAKKTGLAKMKYVEEGRH